MRFFDPESRPEEGWRARVYEVIFETDTPAGKLFDTMLLGAILLSILAISLETVPTFEDRHRQTLRTLEWVLTGLFTAEYILRLVVVHDPRRYALSFMGVVDLLSLLPTYLSLLLADAQVLQVVRALRLLRVFRVFQLGQMAIEGGGMLRALVASRYKIAVFLGTLMILVVIQGALLYFVEHQVNEGFSSIPRSVYWAIVTLTTVGYGDISPVTVPGQAIASVLMLLGYGIIAVPTGIVTAEVTVAQLNERDDIHIEHIVPRRADACVAAAPAMIWVTGATHAGASMEAHGFARAQPEPALAYEPTAEPKPEHEPAPAPDPMLESEPASDPEPEPTNPEPTNPDQGDPS